MIRALALIAALFIAATARGADTKTIHAEWEYGGQATGYRLYVDGVLRCGSQDGSVLAMECLVPLNPGPNTFTMTAMGPDGETPHSAPFVLDYAGSVPRIINNVVIKE